MLPLAEYVPGASLLAVVLRPAYERLESQIGARSAGIAVTAAAVVGGIVPVVLVSLVVRNTTASILESLDGERVLAAGREIARDDLGVPAESASSAASPRSGSSACSSVPSFSGRSRPA